MSEQIEFSFEPVPPFRLDLTAWALRRRVINAVDHWDGDTYWRILVIRNRPVRVAVRQQGTRLDVTLTGVGLRISDQAEVSAVLARLLGTQRDLRPFYEFAASDQRLNRLAQRFIGLKPPRFPTLFEALVNGISCQQLSLTVGITVMNRLAAHCGLAFDPESHAFPRPEDLARMDLTELRTLGYSRQKGQALIEMSQAIAGGRLDLEPIESLGDESAMDRLLKLRGVGRWTAEYALLRGLGRTHVFPGDDVGGRQNLGRWLHLRRSLDYPGVHRVLSRWKPYGGLIYFHLLLDRLDEAGHLT
ncbi:MAG: HhH-GPD family protein [Nitrospira sp.]|jgi:DNA-3-methyladenine glycosylase II|nr:HhH-GPD family protein [Nitrospira sp.]